MSVAAQDILACAEKIAQTADCEADFRAAIGRAYYSSYHHGHAFHSTLASPGQEPPANIHGSHAKLIYRLTYPTVPQNDKGKESRQIGYMIKTLRLERVTADYELAETVHKADAESSATLARSVNAIS